MSKAVSFDFSPITVGTMRLGKWGAQMNTIEMQAFIEGCIELGLNDFDHADIYGDYTTEGDFGKVLKAAPSLRDKIQLITKCGIKMMCDNRPEHKVKSYDSGKDHIIRSAENSLKELQTDYIDLLLIHRPDYLMDPAEISEAFEILHKDGKVKAFGVSNFTPSQFDLLNSSTPLVTNQIEVSILHRNAFEDGTLNQCLKDQIRPMAWSPYGGGAIFSNSDDEVLTRIQKEATTLSNKYGAAVDQILLAWLLKHPAQIIPVLGTSKLERIAQAKKALEINLTREEWYMLWQAATGEPVA